MALSSLAPKRLDYVFSYTRGCFRGSSGMNVQWAQNNLKPFFLSFLCPPSLPPSSLSFFLLFWETCLSQLHSPHSARPGQEHSWPDLVEPVDRRMERSPPRARFLRKHAQVWGLRAWASDLHQTALCLSVCREGAWDEGSRRQMGRREGEGVSRPKLCQQSSLMCASIMGICALGKQGSPLGETVRNNNYCNTGAKLCLNCWSLPTSCRCQERWTQLRMGL